ncbi:hypothetical protein HUG20_16850 [Salicibibacter cibi]|uniref:Uncharacterized protein n=1 Tax=Salicibibacter cibi TaxID=2743001 RepID=A0A7T6ZDA6_9BACI|nr:hypothetical protein [Salicibibacter cibi]QQK81413.1 hypothetical protein HUG20_16850 [Salicibibacter cibi]
MYSIQGESESAYASNQEESEITLFDQENFEVEHSMNLSGDPISVESTMPNTVVFIDGDEVDQIEEEDLEDSEGMLQSDEGKEIGDVSAGHEIHGEVELPWATATSDPVEVEEDTNTYTITPDPVSEEETEEALTQVINDYMTDRMEALTEQDMDVLDTDAISEEIESDIESDVQDYDDENYLEGDVLGTRIDFGDVDYRYADGGTHTLSIPVESHEDTRQNREIGGDEDFSEDHQQLIVQMIYEDDTWIVDEVDYDNTVMPDEPYMTGDRVVETEFD